VTTLKMETGLFWVNYIFLYFYLRKYHAREKIFMGILISRLAKTVFLLINFGDGKFSYFMRE